MTGKERLAETVFESLAAMMAAYAAEAVRVAWSSHRQRLDLGESSIEVLEAILSGQSTEELEFQTRLWGSYLGEVLRQSFGGEWDFTQYPGGVAVTPTLLVGDSRLFPLMKVHRRLTLGNSGNLPAFYRMVAERLKAG